MWLRAIQLLNIMLSANNHKGDLVTQEKYREASQTWNWPLHHQNRIEKERWKDDIAMGAQVLTAILQATVAYHYRTKADELTQQLNTSTKLQHLPPIDESNIDETENDGSFLGGLKTYFNKKTGKYVSVVEKSVKGVLELTKALGEIGAMTEPS